MMETYNGYVRTPGDAIKLFEACRLGLLPRVQRRLSEKERQSIRSGSVFVWDEREAGMRRWTDGKSWSASRVSGSFLTYREMEGKRGGFGSSRRGAGKTPDSSGRGSDDDQDDDGPDGYRYKADGLMKQSFSITTSAGQHLHLISYYSRPQSGQPELQQPTSDPSLRHIVPIKGMYPESSMTETPIPAMTRTPMTQPPYPPQQPGQPYAFMHNGYPSWPPSPMTTPPHYAHVYAVPASVAYAQQHAQMAPMAPGAPPPHYAVHPYGIAPPVHERATLPPPNATQTRAARSPHHHYARHASNSPHVSQARLPQYAQSTSQATQAAIYAESRAAGNSMATSSGPLPAISATATPPSRTTSISPPRSSHSDTPPNGGCGNGGSSKAPTLSSLLHPASANGSETKSVNGTNSASSSPRQGRGPATPGPSMMTGSMGSKPTLPTLLGEDQRALSVLDKKFCI